MKYHSVWACLNSLSQFSHLTMLVTVRIFSQLFSPQIGRVIYNGHHKFLTRLKCLWTEIKWSWHSQQFKGYKLMYPHYANPAAWGVFPPQNVFQSCDQGCYCIRFQKEYTKTVISCRKMVINSMIIRLAQHVLCVSPLTSLLAHILFSLIFTGS